MLAALPAPGQPEEAYYQQRQEPAPIGRHQSPLEILVGQQGSPSRIGRIAGAVKSPANGEQNYPPWTTEVPATSPRAHTTCIMASSSSPNKPSRSACWGGDWSVIRVVFPVHAHIVEGCTTCCKLVYATYGDSVVRYVLDWCQNGAGCCTGQLRCTGHQSYVSYQRWLRTLSSTRTAIA